MTTLANSYQHKVNRKLRPKQTDRMNRNNNVCKNENAGYVSMVGIYSYEHSFVNKCVHIRKWMMTMKNRTTIKIKKNNNMKSSFMLSFYFYCSSIFQSHHSFICTLLFTNVCNLYELASQTQRCSCFWLKDSWRWSAPHLQEQWSSSLSSVSVPGIAMAVLITDLFAILKRACKKNILLQCTTIYAAKKYTNTYIENKYIKHFPKM